MLASTASHFPETPSPSESLKLSAAPQRGHKMYGTITKSVATAPLET